MISSVAIQVVIGLIFIYLLYSLLASVVAEIIASILGLRARNLRAAIHKMLGDKEFVKSIYNNNEIKSLGGPGIWSAPSAMRPGSFSKALVGELSGNGPVTGDKISAVLKVSATTEGCNGSATMPGAISPDTANYLLQLWEEAGGEVGQFRNLIEDWFNRSMEQASGWYKRKIRLVLLVIGFCIAWFFCADTITIVRKLSVDKDAREKMVLLADAWSKANAAPNDTLLLEARKKLATDMAGAESVLGLGGWLPDRIRVATDPVTKEKTYTPQVDPECLSATSLKISNGNISFTFGNKLAYFFRLAWQHFFGFLVTTVAISLGAPFWFDLLKKIMKLRTLNGKQS